MMSIFLCLIGGLGSSTHRSISHTNGMIASFILFPAVYHGSLAPAAFTTAAEVGTAEMREKTMAFAVSSHLGSHGEKAQSLIANLDCCKCRCRICRCFLNSILAFSILRRSRFKDWVYIWRHNCIRSSMGFVVYA